MIRSIACGIKLLPVKSITQGFRRTAYQGFIGITRSPPQPEIHMGYFHPEL